MSSATQSQPYEKGFYKLENVVGYTGDLVKRVGSLYFQDQLHNKYGRITFGHGDSDNNGRGRVDTTQDYKRKNMFLDEKLFPDASIPLPDTVSDTRSPWHQKGGFTSKVQVEYVAGEIVHVSRGQFIKISAKSLPQNKSLITYIIDHFPDSKGTDKSGSVLG